MFDSDWWFRWAPCFLLAIFIGLMLWQIHTVTDFIQQPTTVVTTGKILQVETQTVGSGSYSAEQCIVTYQFFTLTKRRIEGQDPATTCPFYYQVGDSATIAYDRTEPEHIEFIPPGGPIWGIIRSWLPLFLFTIPFSIIWILLG